MARQSRSLIAREDSQAAPRWRNEPAFAQPVRKGVGGIRREVQSLCTSRVMRDNQLVAGQCLPADDFAQVVGKMLKRREAAGFGMEMHKIKTPTALLATAML